MRRVLSLRTALAAAVLATTACHEVDPTTPDVRADTGGGDATDSTDSADGTEATDGTEAGDGTDGTDSTDSTDSTDASDGTPTACTTDAGCDDNLACTTDRCDDGLCAHTVAADACLVSATCLAAGESPTPCMACTPSVSQTALTPATGTCDDGDTCTTGDTCAAGACVGGAPPDCDDGVLCTDDACAPEVGCVNVPNDLPCDDGDACTTSDACLLAFCVGTPRPCDDGNPCTTDACATGDCTHAPLADGAACDDGDDCVVGETCGSGVCGGGLALVCDDSNPCTIDYCDPNAGCGVLPTESPCCLGSANVCDDLNPCTADTCDPVTTDCSYTVLDGQACDDGEPCTTGETCAGETCDGGTTTVCDDGNVCTSDVCILGEGCKTFPQAGPCDDGLACSTGDTCDAGQCVANTTGCGCIVPANIDAAKVATIQIATDAKPGSALDLDGDPATCAPSSGCSGGVHNSFSVLAGLANAPLADAVAGGSIVLLVTAPQGATGAFDMVLYQGGLDPSNPGCDLATQSCAYTVDKGSFDAACAPRFVLPATLDGNTLSAGSITSQIPFAIPLQGVTLEVVVYAARLEGTVTLDAGNITSFTGVLGGAIGKTALFAAIDNLPAEGLPVPKDLIKSILQTSLEFDIDTNDDGVGDAASIALKLTGIDAVLTTVVD